MRKKNILAIAILLTIIIVLSGCSNDPTGKVVEQEEIKIGAIIPLTGWGAYWGEPVKEGMELAIQELESKGNNPVKLYIEDSKSDLKEAVTAAHKLLNIDSADIIHVELSGPSTAVSPVVKEKQKILIYSGFTLTPVKSNPNAFKMYFDPYVECKKLAEIAISKGYQHITLMMATLDFGEQCKKGIEEATIKTKIAFSVQTFNPFDVADFRTELIKMKEKGTDVIIMLGYENNFALILKQKNELGLNSIKFYCGSKADCLTKEVLENSNAETLEGNVAFDIDVSSEFTSKYLAAHPNRDQIAVFPAANGYDSVMLIADAYKKCKSKDVECLKQKLIESTYQTEETTYEGFNKEQRLTIKTTLEEFQGGKLIRIS